MYRRTLILLVLVPLCTVVSVVQLAQSEESPAERESVLRKQEEARKLLKLIEGKIRRVAQRLSERDRVDEAKRLERARKLLIERTVEDDMRRAQELISQGKLMAARGVQAEIYGKLEKMVRILLDQQSMAETRLKLERLAAQQAQLDALQKRQDEHIKKMDSLRDAQRNNVPKSLNDVRKKIENLRQQQDELQRKTRKASSAEMRNLQE